MITVGTKYKKMVLQHMRGLLLHTQNHDVQDYSQINTITAIKVKVCAAGGSNHTNQQRSLATLR